ncbi:MAG: carbohydrate ABC transporter permease [Lachnospiraceae bacterium]|jgi:putative aldouronate transport system permease protein|nr:carbohydrate ABC transporter permease [Lachnospiraceae bacterium]
MKKGSFIQSGVRVRESLGSRIFTIINGLFLVLLALMCVLPLVNILAVSLSSNAAATAGLVKLWPVEFTLKSYEYVAKRAAFWRSLGVTLLRCLLGVSLNVLMCILTAYPLSKDNQKLRARTVYTWFFFITMLVNGGLIPQYMTIKSVGILGTIWALVLPGAVPVFSMVLMLNFFRAIPEELEEAAFMDGASHWSILMKIYVPLSKASIATICLFALVYHWNSWFDGIIMMNKPDQYPLQSYLHTIIIQGDTSVNSTTDWQTMALISDRTVKCAQIFLSTLPIVAAYPFLQRYFVKGMVMGSVKG